MTLCDLGICNSHLIHQASATPTFLQLGTSIWSQLQIVSGFRMSCLLLFPKFQPLKPQSLPVRLPVHTSLKAHLTSPLLLWDLVSMSFSLSVLSQSGLSSLLCLSVCLSPVVWFCCHRHCRVSSLWNAKIPSVLAE